MLDQFVMGWPTAGSLDNSGGSSSPLTRASESIGTEERQTLADWTRELAPGLGGDLPGSTLIHRVLPGGRTAMGWNRIVKLPTAAGPRVAVPVFHWFLGESDAFDRFCHHPFRVHEAFAGQVHPGGSIATEPLAPIELEGSTPPIALSVLDTERDFHLGGLLAVVDALLDGAIVRVDARGTCCRGFFDVAVGLLPPAVRRTVTLSTAVASGRQTTIRLAQWDQSEQCPGETLSSVRIVRVDQALASVWSHSWTARLAESLVAERVGDVLQTLVDEERSARSGLMACAVG